MKLIVAVFVILALALGGFVGFIAFDSSSEGSAQKSGIVGRKVTTISYGEEVDFSQHVTPGVVTIFNFTGDW